MRQFYDEKNTVRTVCIIRTDLNQTFSVQPADVTVSGGDVAVFFCRIGGAPWPRIRWFKEDAEITNVIDMDGQGGRGQGSRYVVYSVQGEGMLQITAVRSSDAGRYRCQADNGGVGLDQQSPRFSRSAQLSFNASSGAGLLHLCHS